MTGLEKIVTAIQEEAQAEAKGMIDQARAEALQILSNEKAKTDDLCAEIEASARQQAVEIERACSSSIELQRRRRFLETKHQLLEQTLKQAHEKLASLPENEYFSLFIKIAVACAEPGEGELLLCERDLKRIPDGFEVRLREALPKGVILSVSDKTRPIEGGFILKYGNIEQNCSFRAIFDARREELNDRVRDILFQ